MSVILTVTVHFVFLYIWYQEHSRIVDSIGVHCSYGGGSGTTPYLRRGQLSDLCKTTEKFWGRGD